MQIYARFTYYEDLGPNHPHEKMSCDIPVEKADLSADHVLVIFGSQFPTGEKILSNWQEVLDEIKC